MESFENKIKKIKTTIDDIRNDIKGMKSKNDIALKNVVNSVSNIKNNNNYINESDNLITLGNNETNYDTGFKQKYNLNYDYIKSNTFQSKHLNKIIPPINKFNNTISNNNSNLSDFNDCINTNKYNTLEKQPNTDRIIYDNKEYNYNYEYKESLKNENILTDTTTTSQLEKRIAELNLEIEQLQRNNTILQKEISRNKNKSKICSTNTCYDTEDNKYTIKRANSIDRADFIKEDYNYEKEYKEIVFEMIKIMGNNCKPNDIIKKFTYYMNTFQDNKVKDEFIKKLSKIYSDYNRTRGIVEIKILWRWVKDIIKINQKSLEYTKICETIMNENNLNDTNELKDFILETLSKNKKNRQKVDKIKEIVLTDQKNINEYSY